MNSHIPECSILNGSTDGRCYRMFKSSVAVTWVEAQSGCENEGGSLIIIRDAIQQKLIHHWLIQRVILDYEQNVYIGKILELRSVVLTSIHRRHFIIITIKIFIFLYRFTFTFQTGSQYKIKLMMTRT